MPKTTKFILSTIPHTEHRYPTVGDWRPGKNGAPDEIVVSDMKNEDYEFLVMIHEFIEFYLCKKKGVTDVMVTAFDEKFEEERAAGMYAPDVEPGDHPDAPYRREHFIATNIERQLADLLGVDWLSYDDTVMNL